MSRIFIHGTGAVSPAGWGVGPLVEALRLERTMMASQLPRPSGVDPLLVNRVPIPSPKPSFLTHPRMRRASPISQFALGAALEAVGADAAAIASGAVRLGIVFCAFTGSVNYSRRFYAEVLKDPAGASPLLFTETVFNAPASHLATVLGTTAATYTLVGDDGEFIQALALAAAWLTEHRVDACLVVGAEESDWLTAEALRIFSPDRRAAEGAAALYLRREPASAELAAVSDPFLYLHSRTRAQAALELAASFEPAQSEQAVLCDGLDGSWNDSEERTAWERWSGRRVSVRRILGEGFAASGGWQAVVAAECIRSQSAQRAVVSVVGANLQAVGAEFRRNP